MALSCETETADRLAGKCSLCLPCRLLKKKKSEAKLTASVMNQDPDRQKGWVGK